MTAFEWASAKEGVIPPSEFYCATRDVAQTRIERTRILMEKQGWTEERAAFLTAVIGELANNAFDHNLGTWRDIPGCWLEVDISKEAVRAFVADRGQGILSSLKHVRPTLAIDKDALHLAFTEELSGRAPEKRGNGLKFVIRSINKVEDVTFLFQTGNAKLECATPIDSTLIDEYIQEVFPLIGGVYAEAKCENI